MTIALPPLRWRVVHLVALWAFGVAQPIFSMLQGNPEFLVVRGSTRADVIVFGLILAFGLPLVAVGVQAFASLASEALSGALHIAAMWCAAALACLQVLRLLDLGSAFTLLLPLVPATLLVLLYLRSRQFRSVLSLSAALPVVGLLFFVATVPLAVDDRPGAEVEVATRTPVVLVMFDELPVSSLLRADGTLDEERYPSFARLARDSTWYQTATAVHASSTQAVPAILTGRLPRRGEVPTLANHPDNVFTLLGERYAIRAHEQVTRLCPTRYCPRTRTTVDYGDRQRGLFYDVSVGYLHRVLPRSIRGGLPPIGQRWGGFGDGSQIDTRELVLGALDENAWNWALAHARGHESVQFETFVRSLRSGERARTLYVEHALLPHTPWYFLPSGRRYGHSQLLGIDQSWNRWRSSQPLVDRALQRHKLQVGYTDRLLGRLLRRLEDTGLYDKALVVVTADHGASFRSGGFFRDASRENIGDIAAVPLFVKYPNQRRGRVDARHAKTIDILPTIADVVGVEVPWPVDGSSLRRASVARPVTMGTFRGGTVRVDRLLAERGVRATARRNAALLGEGDDSMYLVGPHADLVGRRVESVTLDEPLDYGTRFLDDERYQDVRMSSVFIPARIVGEIESDTLRSGSPLAVSVNGTIAATTVAQSDGASMSFDAIVPEMSFREGRNSVELFLVKPTRGSVALARLGSADPKARQAAARAG